MTVSGLQQNRVPLCWIAGCFVLAAVLLLSLLLGPRPIAPSAIVDILLGHQHEDAALILHGRLPRTVLALLVGIALGLSGIVMQAMTRNPLADPGILGINAGAGFAVVLVVALFNLTGQVAIMSAALLGTFITSILVFLLGRLSSISAHPAHFVLAGVAINAVLGGIASAITLLNPAAFERIRFWNAGSVEILDLMPVLSAAPLFAIGMVLALLLATPLNALVLGQQTASALGVDSRRVLPLALLALTLLVGCSTALAGPIGFVGLMIPHLARWLVGQEHRLMMAFTCLLSPTLLISADILGRFLLTNGLRVSVVTAVIGAPVMIWLVRRQERRG